MSTSLNCGGSSGTWLEGLTNAQRATLTVISEHAEWNDADGAGYDSIAVETATGDPVIYIYDEHRDAILRRDGSLDRSEGQRCECCLDPAQTNDFCPIHGKYSADA